MAELSLEVTHDMWKVAQDSKTGIHILLTINEFSDRSNASTGIGHIDSEVIEKYVISMFYWYNSKQEILFRVKQPHF